MLTVSRGSKQVNYVVSASLMAIAIVAQGEAAHRVKAALVAEESSLHTSVNNRDVYRLRVTPHHGAAFDAIVIDNYPGYAEALPLHGMPKDTHFSVKLIRTPYCDQVGNDEQGTLRCFAIERGSWKGQRAAETDQWWK